MSKVNLKSRISFHSSEWRNIKEWLQEERQLVVAQLIGAKTHDESQEYRGKIKLIDKLLYQEKDAAEPASN